MNEFKKVWNPAVDIICSIVSHFTVKNQIFFASELWYSSLYENFNLVLRLVGRIGFFVHWLVFDLCVSLLR